MEESREIVLHNRQPPKPPAVFEGTPEELIKGVKQFLQRSLLEEEDYTITEHSILFDLKYCSRHMLAFYVGELNKLYPGLVKVSNKTHINIHYPKGQTYVKPERQPVRESGKQEDWRNGSSRESTQGYDEGIFQ